MVGVSKGHAPCKVLRTVVGVSKGHAPCGGGKQGHAPCKVLRTVVGVSHCMLPVKYLELWWG